MSYDLYFTKPILNNTDHAFPVLQLNLREAERLPDSVYRFAEALTRRPGNTELKISVPLHVLLEETLHQHLLSDTAPIVPAAQKSFFDYVHKELTKMISRIENLEYQLANGAIAPPTFKEDEANGIYWIPVEVGDKLMRQMRGLFLIIHEKVIEPLEKIHDFNGFYLGVDELQVTTEPANDGVLMFGHDSTINHLDLGFLESLTGGSSPHEKLFNAALLLLMTNATDLHIPQEAFSGVHRLVLARNYVQIIPNKPEAA